MGAMKAAALELTEDARIGVPMVYTITAPDGHARTTCDPWQALAALSIGHGVTSEPMPAPDPATRVHMAPPAGYPRTENTK